MRTTALVVLLSFIISFTNAFDCGGTLCPDDNALITYTCSLAAMCQGKPTALGIFIVFVLPAICTLTCWIACIWLCCRYCCRKPDVVYLEGPNPNIAYRPVNNSDVKQ